MISSTCKTLSIVISYTRYTIFMYCQMQKEVVDVMRNKQHLDINLHDVHCHILYGVDDGAKDKEQTARMLEIAYSEGIRSIILTPHYRRAYDEEEKEIIEKRFGKLKAYVEQKYSDMSLHMGNEIFFYNGVEKDLLLGNAYTMAGGRYVLLEFMPGAPYSYVRGAVATMLRNDYIPILAHVERYECFLKDFDKVWEIKERGALLQVNANSIMGGHGGKEKRFCRKLIKYDLLNFVGTDAHRDDTRKPEIQKCVQWVIRKYGEEYARLIFESNPQKIINDEEIVEE